MEMQIETAIISINTLYSSLEVPFCQRAEGTEQTMSHPSLQHPGESENQHYNSQTSGKEADQGEGGE